MVRLGLDWRGLFAPARGVEPGVYHYRRELADRFMRLHLRVDPDGTGLLSVNASGVIHLNETALLLMKLVLDGKTKDAAIAEVRRVYRARREDIARDYDRILDAVGKMETSEDACPIFNVDAMSIPPFARKPTAPYRADLALTYACNDDCKHCYVARKPEDVTPLTLDEWRTVMDKLWAVGVPHVCFTGGEATVSPHLVSLIERAEDIGMITGLLTNGRKLSDRTFTKRLCNAGLDHVQITLESHSESVHDEMVNAPGAWKETVEGIRNAVAEDIYLVTNTTLCTLNVDTVEETLEFLKDLGVRQFAMNSIINTGRAPGSKLGIDQAALEPILGLVTDKAEELGLRFIWYSPTHYCQLNPAQLGVGFKRCTAAEYNICVEPDGNVLPCQSYYKPVGNLLKDDWKSIWESPLFLAIRNRTELPDDCVGCPDLEVCGGGCPLSGGDKFLCTDSASEG
ncbi:MAG: PqqD family peptide modification chaperone [Candidatus Hydrogenedentales bacterium]|jgi:radical SAM protein with 4Fe4S-binding SPASM domain